MTDLIVSSDSVGNGHFSDYHRFFSQAVWNIDRLWRLLAILIVGQLIDKDATILLTGDDTLCRERGLGISGTGIHHDSLSSSKPVKVCHWGHDWVDLCILISNPWWAPSKVFALPICMRLYQNRQGLTKGNRNSTKKPTKSQVRAASAEAKKVAKAEAAANAKAIHKKDAKSRKTRPELLADMIELVCTIKQEMIACCDWYFRKTLSVVVQLGFSTAPTSVSVLKKFCPSSRSAGQSK